MNVVIVGQGAIGLLFYHFINKNKLTKDSLTLRPSFLVSLSVKNNKTFYQFTDINGEMSKQPITYADNNAVKNADIILFTVKSYQVKQAIADIEHLIPSQATVILCHNGMGTVDELPSSFISSQPMLTMLTTHGCLKPSPLNIIHTGLGQVDFGLTVNKSTLDNSSEINTLELTKKLTQNFAPDLTHQMAQQLTQLLSPAKFHKNITEKQWLKLAINCVINPLTALHDMNNSGVLEEKFTKQCQNILQEVVLVAKTQHIELELATLIDTVKKVAKATGNNSSSMRCDVTANKKTEVDYINGYVHQIGQKFNIATPINSQLWKSITLLAKDYTNN
ncbi:MAG: 2-dehydropantoate 2-reductase [Colwellia sp.]|nr:2-dehydropantoate 2-reductase [Colwellia sp.]